MKRPLAFAGAFSVMLITAQVALTERAYAFEEMTAEEVSSYSSRNSYDYQFDAKLGKYFVTKPAAPGHQAKEKSKGRKWINNSAGYTEGKRRSIAENVEVVESIFSNAEVKAAQSEVAAWYRTIGGKDKAIAFMFDSMVDAVVIYVNEESFEDAQKRFGEDARYRVILSKDSAAASADYREGMGIPAKGGGKIHNNARGCSAGITARNSNGTLGTFTAGHCFNLKDAIYTGSNSRLGSVTHFYGYPKLDAQFVSGGSYYAPKVITGASSSPVIKPVKSWYFPVPGEGNRLCFSGRTSGENCGNSLHGYGGSYCVDYECHENLIMLTGGSPSQGGDSGGTVYANFGDSVRVSGIVSGVKPYTLHGAMTFASDWREIERTYGAKLVYG